MTNREEIFKDMTDEEILVNGRGYLAFSVGDLVTLTWFGKPTKFRVVHKGYKTENKIVLVKEEIETFHPFYRQYSSDKERNNYANSDIRKYLNTIFLQGFSAEVQAAIANTPVEYVEGGDIQTVKDKLWLLSAVEVGFGPKSFMPVEGKPLDYFDGDKKRIKFFGKEEDFWWLRTPCSDNSNYAWLVDADGTADYYNVTYSYGVVPAFEI